MPLESKTFSELITFTRAGSAWGFDNTGAYKEFLTDEPRIERDPGTRKMNGLLIEEESQNLWEYSNSPGNGSWAASGGSTVSYIADDFTDGFIPLARFTKEGAGSVSVGGPKYTVGSETEVVYSVFLKEGESNGQFLMLLFGTAGVIKTTTVTISDGEYFGNGIYRHYLAAVSTDGAGWSSSDQLWALIYASTPNDTVGAYNWAGGFQLEARQIPTSYIPNDGASLTTRPDEAALVDLTGYDLTGGITIFAQALADDSENAFGRLFQLDDGTNNERALFYRGSTTLGGIVSSGGAAFFSPGFSRSATDKGPFKMAMRIESGDHAAVADDDPVQSNSNVAEPSGMTDLNLGSQTAAVNHLNGHIQKLDIYGRSLTDAELQELTA